MKYFAVSDIHSFYTPLKKSLWNAGYRKSNPNHTLIVCGDVFDRGKETLEVYNFLKSIPKSRLVLIKGNHEYLFEALLEKDFPDNYDFYNGTVRTFCDIVDGYTVDDNEDNSDLLRLEAHFNYGFEEESVMKELWNKIRLAVKQSEVYKWITSSQWINYYELGRFIFTHSFIPVKFKEEYLYRIDKRDTTFTVPVRYLENIPNWRTITDKAQWEQATWGCPWEQYQAGLFNQEIHNGDKCLVVGHWHTSDFHAHLNGVKGERFDIFYNHNLIGLDGCIAHQVKLDERNQYLEKIINPKHKKYKSKVFVNVLVIDLDDNQIYDGAGNLLEI